MCGETFTYLWKGGPPRKTCSPECTRLRTNERKRARADGEYIRGQMTYRPRRQPGKLTRPEAQRSREEFLEYVLGDIDDPEALELMREVGVVP